MTGRCCVGGPAPGRLAPRLLTNRGQTVALSGAPGALAKVTTSILSAAALVFLPKCPLCLAAWLTVATGVSFSAAGAVWATGLVVMFWIAAMVLAAVPMLRRRAFGRAPTFLRRFRSAKLPGSA